MLWDNKFSESFPAGKRLGVNTCSRKCKRLVILAGWALLALLLTGPGDLRGQMISPLIREESPRVSISASSVHQFKSDLGDRGDVSVSRYALTLGGTTRLGERVGLGVRLNYELDKYNFSSANSLSSQNPWDNINKLGLGMRLSYKITDQWNIGGGPIVQFAGESGASLSNSLLYGGLVAATYRASRDFTVGFGAGVFYRLEETRIFPSLLVSWNITDKLRLGNAYRLGPTGPAGLELSYIIDDNWQVAAGGGHQSSRFRLDKNGALPEGIGENSSWPVYARLSRKLGKLVMLDLYGGAALGGKMKLQDSRGNDINTASYNTAPLLGFNLGAAF